MKIVITWEEAVGLLHEAVRDQYSDINPNGPIFKKDNGSGGITDVYEFPSEVWFEVSEECDG